MNITVRFPVKHQFEGVTHEELVLDMSKVNGALLERIEREMTSEGTFMIAPSASQGFLRRVAQHAAGRPSEYFAGMHLANYLAITQSVQGFLSGQVSQETAGPDSSND